MQPETFRDRLRRQVALENESRALGVERYQSRSPLPWRDDPSSRDQEADLPPGRELMRLVVHPVAAAIREFCERVNENGGARTPEAALILNEMGAEEAAFITGRVIMTAAAEDKKLTATAIEVAEALIEHIQMKRLRRLDPGAADGVMRVQKSNVVSSKKRKKLQLIFDERDIAFALPKGTKIRTGVKAIELFCDTTGLFVIESVGNRTKKVRPTEAVHRWLEEQHARCELLEPILLPMIIPPRPWSSPSKGGYVGRRIGNRLVKQPNRAYHDELAQMDLSAVYDAVNAIQSTAWRINNPILELVREVWDGGGVLGDLPSRYPELIPARPTTDDPDIISEWKRDAADTYQRNGKVVTKRLSVSQRIWVAEKFADEEAIYFPHALDFRGRAYPLPTAGPHPQGDDLARALLTFADGLPIGHDGAHWLAVHIANLFGHDKISFAERVEWVFQNEHLLLDAANHPLDGGRFWTQAEYPWMALAACMEWAGYVEQGADFVSHLPVALDGSNSGLQHFSALLRDPVGAAAVNLTPSERPADIYAEVAAALQSRVDHSDHPIAPVWTGRVSRKIAKRPCMTYVYSATRYGFHDMIYQTLRELDAGEKYLPGDNYAASLFLAGETWEALKDTVQAASSAMAWLRQVARIVTQAGLPLRWTTPIGLPVLQRYVNVDRNFVSVVHQGKRVRLMVKSDGSRLDSRRQQNGISPNFIHSMDAAHLMSVANRCADAGVPALAVVHDSFGVHAARAFELRSILRDSFADLYETNWLELFRDEIAAQLPDDWADKLPPLPPLGSFDIESIRRSDYLFA